MKQVIVLLVLLVNVLGTKAFATGDERVSREAKEAFKKEFPLAEAVVWEELKGSDLYMVRFVYESKGHVAYVDPEGIVIASARIVGNANLPFKVNQAINKMYNVSEISKVEELTMGNELSYFFTIEHEGSRILLRVYINGSFQTISKEKRVQKSF
jgi:hypothetical protein